VLARFLLTHRRYAVVDLAGVCRDNRPDSPPAGRKNPFFFTNMLHIVQHVREREKTSTMLPRRVGPATDKTSGLHIHRVTAVIHRRYAVGVWTTNTTTCAKSMKLLVLPWIRRSRVWRGISPHSTTLRAGSGRAEDSFLVHTNLHSVQIGVNKIDHVPRCRRRMGPFFQANAWFGTDRVTGVTHRNYAVPDPEGISASGRVEATRFQKNSHCEFF
jgi:hypothetical protein